MIFYSGHPLLKFPGFSLDEIQLFSWHSTDKLRQKIDEKHPTRHGSHPWAFLVFSRGHLNTVHISY